MMRLSAVFLILALTVSCTSKPAGTKGSSSDSGLPNQAFVVVLGIAQDGGAPHPGCEKECCRDRWGDPAARHRVTCIGIVDPVSNQCWIIDATPDFPEQQHELHQMVQAEHTALDGIFLTHAHIGHYTGLMYLGRESMGANRLPVYAMPAMKAFLEQNGPWDILVRLRNIEIHEMSPDQPVRLNERIVIRPIPVPHRGEYTETIGVRIRGPEKTLLYVPDIDRWETWGPDILKEVEGTDHAFIDGTFFSGEELPGRNMSKIPHPAISHSMDVFDKLDPEDRSKIHFIHFNHTNPVLQETSEAYKVVVKNGFKIAFEGQIIPL